jgi:hypothetical protein
MTASLNALVHGCCSKKLILPDERQEDFDRLLRTWLDDYQPENETFLRLVVYAAEQEWYLRRNTLRYNQIEQKLSQDPLEWSEEDHKKLERFTRYRTTAERGFHRARNAVEQTRKNRLLEEQRRIKLDLVLRQEKEQEDKKVKNNLDPDIFKAPEKADLAEVQSIDICLGGDGKTVTSFYPSNEELLEQSKTADPPIRRILRIVYFPDFIDGLPPEYEWLDEELPGISTSREQMLSFDEWLAAVEREKRAGTGHLVSHEIHQKEK